MSRINQSKMKKKLYKIKKQFIKVKRNKNKKLMKTKTYSKI